MRGMMHRLNDRLAHQASGSKGSVEARVMHHVDYDTTP